MLNQGGQFCFFSSFSWNLFNTPVKTSQSIKHHEICLTNIWRFDVRAISKRITRKQCSMFHTLPQSCLLLHQSTETLQKCKLLNSDTTILSGIDREEENIYETRACRDGAAQQQELRSRDGHPIWIIYAYKSADITACVRAEFTHSHITYMCTHDYIKKNQTNRDYSVKDILFQFCFVVWAVLERWRKHKTKQHFIHSCHIQLQYCIIFMQTATRDRVAN